MIRALCLALATLPAPAIPPAADFDELPEAWEALRFGVLDAEVAEAQVALGVRVRDALAWCVRDANGPEAYARWRAEADWRIACWIQLEAALAPERVAGSCGPCGAPLEDRDDVAREALAVLRARIGEENWRAGRMPLPTCQHNTRSR